MRSSRNCPYPKSTLALVQRTKRNRVSLSNPRLKRGDGTRQVAQWLAIKALYMGSRNDELDVQNNLESKDPCAAGWAGPKFIWKCEPLELIFKGLILVK
jgi:hypothetical protein